MPSDRIEGEARPVESSPLLAGFRSLPALTEKLMRVETVRDLYRRTQESTPWAGRSAPSLRTKPASAAAEPRVDALRVDALRVDPLDVERIPASGPTVVLANHLMGARDGLLLANLLKRIRPDVRVWRRIPKNPGAEARALSWLSRGGLLAVFPADEVTPHWQFSQGQIADSPWACLPVRVIRQSGAAVLPVYLCGSGRVLNILGNPQARPGSNAFPLDEFLRRKPRPVEIRVGSEIPPESIASITDDEEAIAYLRWRTYLLARRGASSKSKSWPRAMRAKMSEKVQQPLAEAEEAESLAAELHALTGDRTLVESGDLTAYLAKAGEIPGLLRELGRLREYTFRGAGEGTGKSRDLDRFDQSYWHILLWNKARRELVGAYRAGNTAEILAERGIGGLYTSTLFRYDAQVFEKLGPALELGRSFVRPEYQRQYSPLLLLWKAIARLLATHPEIAVVFGPVSISNDYSKASREMIYRFFESRMKEDELAGMVAPRKPFRPAVLRPWDCRAMCHALRDLEELSSPITDVETDGKGLPILLRQYAKIGGKLLAFNVDRKFSNVLDGLVVVDLRRTERSVLDRYMGKESAERFRRYHRLDC